MSDMQATALFAGCRPQHYSWMQRPELPVATLLLKCKLLCLACRMSVGTQCLCTFGHMSFQDAPAVAAPEILRTAANILTCFGVLGCRADAENWTNRKHKDFKQKAF